MKFIKILEDFKLDEEPYKKGEYWAASNESIIGGHGKFEVIEIVRYISKEQRYKVLQRQKWNCNQCGCKLKYSKQNIWDAEVAHIDHIFPFSKLEEYKNGAENINESSNLQALCPTCNLSKSKKEIQ